MTTVASKVGSVSDDAALRRAIAEGVIVPEQHARLLGNLEQFARTAGIPPRAVMRGLGSEVTEREVKSVAQVRAWAQGGCAGICYWGDPPALPILPRMTALTAWCLRNYVDARIVTSADVVAAMQDGEPPPGTLVMIPDFLPYKVATGTTWRAQVLWGALQSRQRQGLGTIIYVPRVEVLVELLGGAAQKALEANFVMQEA